jgi:hypothetical protein
VCFDLGPHPAPGQEEPGDRDDDGPGIDDDGQRECQEPAAALEPGRRWVSVLREPLDESEVIEAAVQVANAESDVRKRAGVEGDDRPLTALVEGGVIVAHVDHNGLPAHDT